MLWDMMSRSPWAHRLGKGVGVAEGDFLISTRIPSGGLWAAKLFCLPVGFDQGGATNECTDRMGGQFLVALEIFDQGFPIDGEILVETGGGEHRFIDIAGARIFAGDIIGGHVVINFRAGLVGRYCVGNLKRCLNGGVKSFPHVMVFAFLGSSILPQSAMSGVTGMAQRLFCANCFARSLSVFPSLSSEARTSRQPPRWLTYTSPALLSSD